MNKPEYASKKQLSKLRKLKRKKYRYEYKLFIAEGLRTVEQIIANKKLVIESIYFDDSTNLWESKVWNKESIEKTFYLIKRNDFSEICDTDNPQGVFVVCKVPEEIDLEVLGKRKGLVIVTDRIQDPGNLGTMIRTAVWFGATGIIIGKGTVDLFHPKVVRSTAGATGILPYLVDSTINAISSLERMGWQTVLLDGKPGAQALSTYEPGEHTVLVVGNEAGGINEILFSSTRLRLSIQGNIGQKNVESLNAAMALGIAIYEISKNK